MATVTRAPLTVTIDEDGTTRVHHRFVVSAPLSGQVERIDLDPGDNSGEGCGHRPAAGRTGAVARCQEPRRSHGGHRTPLAAEVTGGVEPGAQVVAHPPDTLVDGDRVAARP